MHSEPIDPENSKVLSWLLWIPVAMVLIVAAVVLLYRGSLDRQIDARLETIRQASHPTTFQELAERYEQEVSPESGQAGEDYQEAFAILRSKEGNFAQTQAQPDLAELLPAGEWSEELHDRVDRFLDENQAAIDRVHRASRGEPRGFPISFFDAFDLELPHLPALQAASRLFQIKALSNAEKRERDAAFEAMETLLAIPNALHGEPLLFSMATRVQLKRRFFSILESVLYRVEFTTEQLEHLKGILEGQDNPCDFAPALHAERVLGLHFFDLPGSERNQALEKLMGETGFLLRLALVLYERTGRLEHDQLSYLEGIERYLEINQGSPTERLEQSLEFDFARLRGNEMSRFYSSILLPRFYPAFQRDAARLAEERLARMALTVEIHRAGTGRLPVDRLPDGIVALEDPFSGSPLLYRFLSGGEMVFYSVGPYGKGTGENEEDIRIVLKTR